jgi:protein-tyrosine phosphatase
MTKILFVCLGNICRSPMAEYVFKNMIEKEGKADEFIISSAATSTEEIGNDMHYGTRRKLDQEGIKYTRHCARQLTYADYKNYDYIIGMEESNIRNIIKIIKQDSEHKVHRLLDFSNDPRDIDDPWYTGNFDKTYKDVVEGCKGLLKFIYL